MGPPWWATLGQWRQFFAFRATTRGGSSCATVVREECFHLLLSLQTQGDGHQTIFLAIGTCGSCKYRYHLVMAMSFVSPIPMDVTCESVDMTIGHRFSSFATMMSEGRFSLVVCSDGHDTTPNTSEAKQPIRVQLLGHTTTKLAGYGAPFTAFFLACHWTQTCQIVSRRSLVFPL